MNRTKKTISLLLALFLALSVLLTGCSSAESSSAGSPSSDSSSSDGNTVKSDSPAADSEDSENASNSENGGTASGEDASKNSDDGNNKAISAQELDSLLAQQPLYVSKTEYVVQSEEYKTLYPDMLQAILQSNTTDDIKDAVVAFVAWDSNGLPVKIEGQFDFGDGSYVKKFNYSDINLAAGGSYGDSSGFSLTENNNIDTFKAICISYETFEGKTWENPYYDDFCSLYEGKKIS